MRIYFAHDRNQWAVSLTEGDSPDAAMDLARQYGVVRRGASRKELFPVRMSGRLDLEFLTAEQLRDRLPSRAA